MPANYDTYKFLAIGVQLDLTYAQQAKILADRRIEKYEQQLEELKAKCLKETGKELKL